MVSFDSTNRAARQSGITLLELVAGMAVIAVLLGTAIPSFAGLLGKNRTTLHSNTLLQSLLLARNRAISEYKMVHVCQIDAGNSQPVCADDYSSYRSWNAGWMVFFDHNENNNFDDADEIIHVEPGNNSIYTLFNQRGRLRFFPSGRARSAGFTLCDASHTHYRHIYLLHTGRARISRTVSEKQKHKCRAAAARK